MPLTSETIEAVTAPNLISVLDKQNALLLDLAARSAHPGAVVKISPMDHIVVDANPGSELTYHVQSLIARKLLEPTRKIDDVLVSSQGWEHLEHLRNPATGSRSDIFVAMAFKNAPSGTWESGIRPGIIAAGYQPKRVDSDPHNDKIDDRIIAGIRACYAIVVDVTSQNAGAYFEAGFAMGLGRAVVWTVQEADLPNLHFDTRQFNHIIWTDPPDLAGQLAARLLAVFGRGPVSAA